MKKNLLFLIVLLFFSTIIISQNQIPTKFWCINHWMPLKYKNFPNEPNGRVDCSDTIQKMVKIAGVQCYRIGGSGFDEFGTAIGTDSTSNDYVKAMKVNQA